MKIIVACEETQVVTIELRRLGHEAYSCDIIECSGGHPEWHIMQDVLPLINGNCSFQTLDGKYHEVKGKWDMIIAFPPCTHLAVSGARHFEKKRADGRQQRAVEFFCQFLYADCERIAVENPVGIISGDYIPEHFPNIAKTYNLPRKPTQIIQPYEFGDPYKKTTCLWLKNLPPLTPTNIVEVCDIRQYVMKRGKNVGKVATFSDWINKGGKDRQTARSKTFPGIAKAMAEQWAGWNKRPGYWIETVACENLCSECGRSSDTVKALDICPNCGKSMETHYIYPSLQIYEEETGRKVFE